LDPVTAALECRSLPEGVAVEDPRHQCGVNGWCGYGLSCSLSIADMIALGLFFFFFFFFPRLRIAFGLVTLLVVGVFLHECVLGWLCAS
jgi:hypothetical protein